MEKLKILVLSRGLFDETHRAAIQQAAPEAEVVLARNADAAGDYFAQAEVIVTSNWEFPVEVFRRATSLKWLHAISAGVEFILYPEMKESEVIMSCARGIFDTPAAEHTLALLLGWARGVDKFARWQEQAKWGRMPMATLQGSTLGIVGMGSIGRELARMAKVGFGMKVVATRMRPEPYAYADKVLPPEGLDELLAESDYVVLAVAATPETKALIGERELRLMKKSAFLVNIARGTVVNEPDLIRALREGWIAGAGLDVVSKEPLPPESELFDLPNVILTGHRAGFTHHNLNDERVANFLENLEDYQNGRPLRTAVDKKLGY